MDKLRGLTSITLRYYLITALLLLLISAPLYYLISKNVYLDEVKESIDLRKKEFYTYHLSNLKESDISLWNRFNRDIQILPFEKKRSTDRFIQKVFFDTLANENEPYLLKYSTFSVQNTQYHLMVRINLVETEDLILSTGFIFFIVLFVLLIGFIFTSRLISKKVWQPFYHSLESIGSFSLGISETPNFQVSKVREFNSLNSSLSELIGENIRRFQREKEFVQNAAHEMQTPLAVIQAKLDQMLQTNDLTEEQANLLEELFQGIARINKLHKNLLLLSRVEHTSYSVQEPIDIKTTLLNLIEQYQEQIEGKAVNLDLSLCDIQKTTANSVLAETLISNMLRNAIQHNVPNGKIQVRLANNCLEITNSGNPQALDPKQLYIPFSSLAKSSQGSGLGSAIMKRIADLNGWTLEYRFDKEFHTFLVHF